MDKNTYKQIIKAYKGNIFCHYCIAKSKYVQTINDPIYKFNKPYMRDIIEGRCCTK